MTPTATLRRDKFAALMLPTLRRRPPSPPAPPPSLVNQAVRMPRPCSEPAKGVDGSEHVQWPPCSGLRRPCSGNQHARLASALHWQTTRLRTEELLVKARTGSWRRRSITVQQPHSLREFAVPPCNNPVPDPPAPPSTQHDRRERRAHGTGRLLHLSCSNPDPA